MLRFSELTVHLAVLWQHEGFYMTTSSTLKNRYHHGDLRKSLIETASLMLKSDGVNGLSLRKLAEQVGVSRTASYHYFKDKS